LTDADLTEARLNVTGGIEPVNLTGADLTGANLTGADLTGACYDAHTRWPTGFDPQRHGAVKMP
jgi:hypothetical protein